MFSSMFVAMHLNCSLHQVFAFDRAQNDFIVCLIIVWIMFSAFLDSGVSKHVRCITANLLS